VRVWDAPTRVFHWLLVALIAASWWSGANAVPRVHVFSGLAVVGLLVFRIYWGFFGSTLCRFASFTTGPRTVLAYARALLKSQASGHIGHNPLGGWSVLAMLGLLATQVGFGLFAVDIDGLANGPLSHLVTFREGRAAARIHAIVFNVLLAAIALHVLAIIFYFFFKKENLVGPMVTGHKKYKQKIEARLMFYGFQRAVIGIVLAGVVVVVLLWGFRF